MEEAWETLEFPVVPHKDSKDVYILGSLEDVQAVLDETTITVLTIASSRHVGPIKSKVDEWLTKLDLFSRTMVRYLNVFELFLYLDCCRMSGQCAKPAGFTSK